MSKSIRWGILAAGLGIAAAAAASAEQSGWTSRRPTSLETPVPVASLPKQLVDGSVDPRAFGVQDYTITVLSGTQFRSSRCYFTDPATLSDTCYCDNCPEPDHTYTTLDIPAGAIIDFIGVNNQTNIEGSLGMTLHFRDHLGGSAQLVALTFPAHEGFVTDFGGPLGILVPDHKDRAFILDVERAAADGAQTNFGYVEVWWRRTVSEPPATPTFGDVPNGHPFYQFIEALARSGITGGCGSGANYCPDAPLTRGQMAVFLAKALGLHWPN